MANDDSVLREVDQELAEERQWAAFRKHGPSVIAAAVIVVLGVAGWQLWNSMQTRSAEAQALAFRGALEVLEEDPTAGRAALEGVADEKGGYGALAALQRAGSYASGGERLKALEIYRSIASGDAPKRVRELAQLRAAYLALADGRDAVIADLGDLTEAEGPFGYYAKEVLALAALDAEDYETALSSFQLLAADLVAPRGVRDRASEFAALASAGKSGVNLTGEAQIQDLLDAVGALNDDAEISTQTPGSDGDSDDPVGDVGAVDGGEDHSGHDHAEGEAHDDNNHEE